MNALKGDSALEELCEPMPSINYLLVVRGLSVSMSAFLSVLGLLALLVFSY